MPGGRQFEKGTKTADIGVVRSASRRRNSRGMVELWDRYSGGRYVGGFMMWGIFLPAASWSMDNGEQLDCGELGNDEAWVGGKAKGGPDG